MGGCMIGGINFGVTKSAFLALKCDSNYHIIFVHYEIVNGTHFEIINVNMYLMELIGIKNI
jgi:hypothetical protein